MSVPGYQKKQACKRMNWQLRTENLQLQRSKSSDVSPQMPVKASLQKE
jgi:hypothetical protein